MKKRKLSSFMTQELLFDYLTDHLDPDRRSLVKEEIEKSPEIQKNLEQIGSGLQYLEDLSKIQLSSLLVENISRQMTYWARIQKTFSVENWPPFVKWTLEAIFVISAVVLISLLIPWNQVKEFVMRESSSDTILVEVAKNHQKSANEDLSNVDLGEKGSFEDEATTPPVVAENKSSSSESSNSSAPKVSAKPVPTPADSKVEEKRKGFVYRGTLSVVNVEAGAIKLKDKIVELGGRKAGEVELGWRRNQGNFYFHFTIPESKLSNLEDYFKTLGAIKLSRDPHPRIMPDGIIRLIITAEETK